MRCDRCVVEMEKGYFHTSLWRPGEVPGWIKVNIKKKIIGSAEKFCDAWKCPNCKRIEFICEE
jgi:hypothetical protein